MRHAFDDLKPSSDDEYLTRDEVARLYRVNPRTLANWELAGFGPPAVKVSRRLTLYSRRAALAFLQSRQTTGAAA